MLVVVESRVVALFLWMQTVLSNHVKSFSLSCVVLLFDHRFRVSAQHIGKIIFGFPDSFSFYCEDGLYAFAGCSTEVKYPTSSYFWHGGMSQPCQLSMKLSALTHVRVA